MSMNTKTTVKSNTDTSSRSNIDASLQPCIKACDIHKSFGSVHVLGGIDLTVRGGTVHGILGPNGAGKSTFVDLCVGSSRPDGGRMKVFGVDPARNAAVVRSHLGVVMQEAAFPTGLKVKDAIACWRRYLPGAGAANIAGRRKTTNSCAQTIPEAQTTKGLNLQREGSLDQQRNKIFDLEKLANRAIHELSGGERRKLDLFLAMMGDPALLVLDEPTTGLDPLARREVWDLIKNLANAGTTILLTSHYLDEVAELCETVSILIDGRINAWGTPAQIAKKYGGGRTAWIEFSHDDVARQALAWYEQHSSHGTRNAKAAGGRATAEKATIRFEGLPDLARVHHLLASPEYRGEILDFAISDHSLEKAYANIVRKADKS